MGSSGGPPGLDALLNELRLAVQALNELAAALRKASLNPPVQMQVEHLEVQTLQFHLGDIDVQELQGEMNIGITHSLKVESPKSQPEPAHKMKPGEPKMPTLPNSVITRWIEQGGPPQAPISHELPQRVIIWPPPETEGKGEA